MTPRTPEELKARCKHLRRQLANELMPESEASPLRRELEQTEEELKSTLERNAG